MYMRGVGALVKIIFTVLSRQETQMETDEPKPSTASERPCVPLPKDYISPSRADEAGMKLWANNILSGYPGGHATSFEQWGNSYVSQFKTVADTMIQSLRIKEEAYSNLFNEHVKERMKAEKSKKETLAVAHSLLDKATSASEKNANAAAELISVKECYHNLKVENEFLKDKLKVSSMKLNKQVESNMSLFTSVKMAK